MTDEVKQELREARIAKLFLAIGDGDPMEEKAPFHSALLTTLQAIGIELAHHNDLIMLGLPKLVDEIANVKSAVGDVERKIRDQDSRT